MKKCTKINKNWLVPALGVLLAALALVFGKTGISQNGFTLNQYHNADAKFIGDHIITSVDEGIRILDLEGKTVASYDGLAASWMYVMEDDVESRGPEDHWFIAYSNHADETHILELTADFQLVEDRIAVTTDTLAIDPILVKMEDGWLLTNTEIDGTINNPSPDGDNGIYSVQLYSSADLKSWEPLTTVISEKRIWKTEISGILTGHSTISLRWKIMIKGLLRSVS